MDNNLILKRFFSKGMLQDILFEKNNSTFNCVIKKYIANPNGKTFKELISEVYTYMGKKYRTEYYYKNTMLNKLLLNSNKYKSRIALTEVPINKSKADFILIGRKGVVYEIKTELDNIERLDSQINDYYKAFKNVVIVTYPENIPKIENSVSKDVGLMVLTKRNSLKMIRNSNENSSLLDYETIFKLLRKREFENIILKYKMSLPTGSQFMYYKNCLSLIKCIDMERLQKEMIIQLKQRVNLENTESILKVTSEVRFLAYFDDIIMTQCEELNLVMNKNFGG